MAKTVAPAADPAAAPASAPPASAAAPAAPASPAAAAAPSASAAGASSPDVEAKVTAAVAEERAKAAKRLEELSAENKRLADAAAAAKTAAEAAEAANAEKLRQEHLATLSESERVKAELAETRRAQAEMKAEIVRVREEAQAEARKLRLDSFRERRIRESGVELVELVTGDSEEAIEASIAKAKERQTGIELRIREKLSAELKLPGPVNTSDAGTKTAHPGVISFKDRRRMMELGRSDPTKYKEAREQMLADAVANLPPSFRRSMRH